MLKPLAMLELHKTLMQLPKFSLVNRRACPKKKKKQRKKKKMKTLVNIIWYNQLMIIDLGIELGSIIWMQIMACEEADAW